MISGDQIYLHLVGDYLIQSDWMALQKVKSHVAASVHALTYSLPFLILKPSLTAWLVIFATHELIDRYRLARYVVWAKNWLGPNRPWSECVATGYPADRPAWLTVWLLIIADNTIHIGVNALCLRYL